MTAREQEEYRALRATIRERGTTRVWVFVVGMVAWAALAVATAAVGSPPVATIVPLLAVVAAFEAVFALHVGVERIGRYLQVFYESDDEDAGRRASRQWERTAMDFGRPSGAPAIDALFSIPFALTAAVNMVPALIVEPTRAELTFVAGAHALFLLRVLVARAAAAKQRTIDLERLQQMKRGS
jgi:hypothetical protein